MSLRELIQRIIKKRNKDWKKMSEAEQLKAMNEYANKLLYEETIK